MQVFLHFYIARNLHYYFAFYNERFIYVYPLDLYRNCLLFRPFFESFYRLNGSEHKG